MTVEAFHPLCLALIRRGSAMPEINLLNVVKYYKGEPQQMEAIQLLQKSMPATLLKNDAAWHVKWGEKPPKPEGGYFTPEMFEALTGCAAHLFPQSFCDDCNQLFEDTGFSEHLNAAQMLMANLMHETGNFRWMQELADGWAYENRGDLGNCKPGDGPRFKGVGVLQLTGRCNYQQLADDIDDPRVMEGVDYVVKNYPFTSAASWIKNNNLLELAKRGEFEAVCVRINGGHNGYDDRCNKYAICQDVMK